MKITFNSDKLEVLSVKGLIYFFEILHENNITKIDNVIKVFIQEVDKLNEITKILINVDNVFYLYSVKNAKNYTCTSSAGIAKIDKTIVQFFMQNN